MTERNVGKPNNKRRLMVGMGKVIKLYNLCLLIAQLPDTYQSI